MELELISRQLKSISLLSPTSFSSHCKLTRGDVVGNYEVGEVLGKGRFATVWSAVNVNNNSRAAIKIYRMGGGNAEYYENEVKLLNKIFEYSIQTQITPTNLIGYMGTFAHVALGHDRAPRIHPCVLFNLAGDSVGKLVKHCRREYGNGLPMVMVKRIMRDTLTGLAYLHKCNIIHTDIKPSNLLLDGKIENIDESTFKVYVGDLGSSTPADNLFSHHVGTTQYIAPELIIEQPTYTTAIDIWAAFAMCYELITTDLLFDVYGECDITYGEDFDELMEMDFAKDSMCDDPTDESADAVSSYYAGVSSDSSGSEDGEDMEKTNYRHLLLIEKIIGPAPKEFTRDARKYYNRRDKLKNNPDVERIGIATLLASNYDLPQKDCLEIEEFLLAGLCYMPEARITAEAALSHPFLQS